jgi:hypothetical protein
MASGFVTIGGGIPPPNKNTLKFEGELPPKSQNLKYPYKLKVLRKLDLYQSMERKIGWKCSIFSFL